VLGPEAVGLSTSLTSAPATNPICTLIVSQDFWPSSSGPGVVGQ